MFTLPENATADQIYAASKAAQRAEELRLLQAYKPDPSDNLPDLPAHVVEELEASYAADETAYEPSDEDAAWIAGRSLADEAEASDWAEYARWAERVDAMHKITDEDVYRATGCVG